MKKFFFFAAALMVSAAAMADEVYTPDQSAYPTETAVKNDGAEKTAVEAGATLYTGTAFDVKNAFAQSYQRVGLAANAYTALQMGGQDIVVADQWGIQGSDNPKDADGGNPALTNIAPTQGAAFQVDVKEDGFIYVFHKASSNKHYTVFEGYNGEWTSMWYEFDMITCPAGKEAKKDNTSWLEGIMCSDIIADSLIHYNPTISEEDGYVVAGGIVFPEIPNLLDIPTYGHIADSASVVKNGAYAQNGLGVIAFPVEANTSYYVNACGSKMSLAAIAFTSDYNVAVTVSNGTETKTLFAGFDAPAAVENVEAAAVVTKKIENGMIVIEKNGRKYNALGAQL